MPCPPQSAVTLSGAFLMGLSIIVLALLLTVFNDGDTEWLNITVLGFGSALLIASSGRSGRCCLRRPKSS